MPRSVHLFDFFGVVPKKDDSLITVSAAMVAEDVDLSSGDIEPIRESLYPISSGGSNVIDAIDIHRGQCQFRSWSYDANPVYGRPNSFDLGWLFWIENGEVKYRDNYSLCSNGGETLGVVPPQNPPTVKSTKTTDIGCETLSSFCYTNVNGHQQESAPSAPSTPQAMHGSSGAEVTLPGAPSGVQVRRIYRSVAGATTGSEELIGSGGEWVMVGEAGRSGGVKNTSGLESAVLAMPSTRWGTPPSNPDCIFFSSVANVLIIGKGNMLHISHPGQYHAFPHDRDIALHDRVIAIREYNNDIIILTDGHPYILTPMTESEGAAGYSVLRGEESYPCKSKASVAVGTTGVVWASTDGAFVIGRSRAGLTVQSITSDVFSYKDWAAAKPETCRGEIYNGAYYFTFDDPVTNKITGHASRTWVLTYDETVYQNPVNIHLVSLSIVPTCWFRSRTDKLYYGYNRGIWEFNPSDGAKLDYTYSSRLVVEAGLSNYSAAKVVNDIDGDLEFQLFREVNGVPVLLYTRPITRSEPFRLPRTNLSVDHFITFKGNATIRRFHMASSLFGLANPADTTFNNGNSRLTRR